MSRGSNHRIDTVQTRDCYDPADFVTVHKDYLARLKREAGLNPSGQKQHDKHDHQHAGDADRPASPPAP